MKKGLIIIVGIVLILLGGFYLKSRYKNENIEGIRTIELFTNVLNKKEKPVFIKFEMEQNVEGRGFENVIMTYAVDGEKVYTNVEASVSVGTIKNGDEFYAVMHNDKLYAKLDKLAYSEDLKIFDEDVAKLDESMFIKGRAEINGIEYDYEEVNKDAHITRYYYNMYDGRFAYLEVDNEIIRIIDYNNKVDKKLFEIPEGYTEVKMN